MRHPHYPSEKSGNTGEAAALGALYASGRCPFCKKRPAPCASCVARANRCDCCDRHKADCERYGGEGFCPGYLPGAPR